MQRERSAGLTEGDQVELSIVIPTRNRVRRIGPLLDQLLADPGSGDVIVVNDGSTDGTAEYLQLRGRGDSRLTVVEGPGKGALRARLAGVQASTSEVVLLLDDDVVPTDGLVRGHLKHHAAGEDILVLGYMPTLVGTERRADDFTTRLYAAEYEGRCDTYRADPAEVLRHLWMGNLSVRRERLLDATVRWPADLPAYRHEDTEIGLRLASIGVRPIFDPSLLAAHEHRRSLAQFRGDSRLDGAGLAQLDQYSRDVFGPPGPDRFSDGLSAPLRQLMRISRHPLAYRAIALATAGTVQVTGRARAYRLQTEAARLLRRLECQQGYLTESVAG